ncbi:hypothetical protein BB021_10930 [Elizabethkingia ursingii]|uniref:Uncharacterized protein n=1 Tax=Elizabethkingia ursingii TaxID=1756150 RepID=A0ABX3N6F8_9FLAO|nr:hypothetical protein BB021_10930 [Elizabethkingia ursingii]
MESTEDFIRAINLDKLLEFFFMRIRFNIQLFLWLERGLPHELESGYSNVYSISKFKERNLTEGCMLWEYILIRLKLVQNLIYGLAYIVLLNYNDTLLNFYK